MNLGRWLYAFQQQKLIIFLHTNIKMENETHRIIACIIAAKYIKRKNELYKTYQMSTLKFIKYC